jgi:excisionase family DNA binding protein
MPGRVKTSHQSGSGSCVSSLPWSLQLKYANSGIVSQTTRGANRLAGETDRPEDPWLTLAEIAAELRVNPATVRLWVAKGTLNATRAGLRKWVVRRSELDRMLAGDTEAADRAASSSRGVAPPIPHRPAPSNPERGRRESAESSIRSAKGRDAAELVRLADRSLNAALAASRDAPPGPGYLDRIRAIADGFEHAASALRNGAAAELRWNPRTTFGWHSLPYELKPDGNRPGDSAQWDEFDAAVERLAITFTGTDLRAVADGHAEVRDRLLDVAEELEAGDASQAG